MNGAAIAVSETFRTTKNRGFVVDSAGRILQKTENGGTQHYFYANDKPVGSSGALAAADFDYNYTPVTDQYPALVPGNYVVSAGDTLRGIALAVYGDAQLWYLIADANGLQTDAELTAGRSLTIPNKVTNLRNAYDTYKPYEPGRIIGDLTPTLPNPPPPKKDGGGCGGLGRIIMLAVQIVVSYLIPGPIGAMIGNLAGQVVGNVLGVQDGISWKEVAKAGLSSFIGGQLGAEGSPLAGSDFPTVVARAAVSNALTQGISVAVGLQDKFDWKGVAAAAVGAGVGHVVGEAIGQAQYGEDWDLAKQNPLNNPGAIAAKYAISQDFGGNLLRGAISGFAGGVARQLVYGGKMNFASIAVDAFGNALGTAMGEYITGPDVKAEQLAALEKAQANAWLGSGLNPGAGGIGLKPMGGIGFKVPEGYVFGPRFRSELPYISWPRPDYGLVGDKGSAPRLNAINGVGPIQIQAGAAAAKGFWGVAAEQLGPGVTNAEIQDYAQRLMSANPGVRFDRMRADTQLTLPDANMSVTDQARGEWARSNALAAAREQARIEAAQRASDNELYREANQARALLAGSTGGSLGETQPSYWDASTSDSTGLDKYEKIAKAKKDYIATDKNGKIYFRDPNTGSFDRNPFTNPGTKNDKVDWEIKLWSTGARGSEKVYTNNPIYQNGTTFFGERALTETYSEGKVVVSGKGLEAKYVSSYRASETYFTHRASTTLGSVDLDVSSSGSFIAEGKAIFAGGGKNGFKVDVGGEVEALAAAVKGSAIYQSPVLNLGIVELQFNAQADGMLGGIGGSLAGGITNTKTTGAFAIYGGAGAVLGLGGKIKGSLSVKFPWAN